LAITAAVVVPSIISTKDLQVIAASRVLASDLQYAQNAAITNQADIEVDFSTSGESYSLSNESGTLIHPITKKAYSVDFDSQSEFDQVNIVAASFNGSGTVTFDALGAPDNAGTVTLQAGSHVYQIDVAAATGKVTVTAVNP